MITIDRASLASAASQCAKIATGYPLRLQAENGSLVLKTANPQQWLTLRVPCEGELPATCVDPAKFAAVVAALLSSSITLETDDGALKFAGGRGKRTLQLVMDDVPSREFTPTATIIVQGEVLADAIGFTLPHAASPDDLAKAHVAGVHLRGDGKSLDAYATDSKTLTVAKVADCNQAFGATISHRTADLISKLSGPVEIGISDRAIEVRWGEGSLIASNVEGDYPVGIIDRALAQEWPHSASFEAPAFLGATRSIRMLGEHDTSTKSERLLLTLNGCAVLSAQSSSGVATEEFPADFDGDEFRIGIIASQAERTMRGFGEAVLEAGFKSPIDPIRLAPAGRSDRLALLYPVKM